MSKLSNGGRREGLLIEIGRARGVTLPYPPQSRQSTRLCLQSSELGLPTPSPHLQTSVSPPPWFRDGGYTLALAEERVGNSPNSDEGTDTVVLQLYICALCLPLPSS
jgi:hypothetical protein